MTFRENNIEVIVNYVTRIFFFWLIVRVKEYLGSPNFLVSILYTIEFVEWVRKYKIFTSKCMYFFLYFFSLYQIYVLINKNHNNFLAYISKLRNTYYSICIRNLSSGLSFMHNLISNYIKKYIHWVHGQVSYEKKSYWSMKTSKMII